MNSISISPQLSSKLRHIADAERLENQSVLRYAIIYRGEVSAWVPDLPRPGGWFPGCWAVPVSMSEPIYVATGGDDMRGAEAWVAADIIKQ